MGVGGGVVVGGDAGVGSDGVEVAVLTGVLVSRIVSVGVGLALEIDVAVGVDTRVGVVPTVAVGVPRCPCATVDDRGATLVAIPTARTRAATSRANRGGLGRMEPITANADGGRVSGSCDGCC